MKDIPLGCYPYRVAIIEEEGGGYSALVLELPGVVSPGGDKRRGAL
jgi:predicted RNase H-like HicB family nuclease